ncbi:unnamed protein product [Symbiodinium natans]|uniref:Uncharacterized protein n=1 Tax=Symbiodinium natans TaxID=878477 RepID=A0A812TV40_9DINO|nr:unnamed protein product [Symbiodinium natans]
MSAFADFDLEAEGSDGARKCISCKTSTGSTIRCPFCLRWWHDKCAQDMLRRCAESRFIDNFTAVERELIRSLQLHRVPSPSNRDWWKLLTDSVSCVSSSAASSSEQSVTQCARSLTPH